MDLLQKELAGLTKIRRLERENQLRVGAKYGADEEKLKVGYNNDKIELTHNKPFTALDYDLPHAQYVTAASAMGIPDPNAPQPPEAAMPAAPEVPDETDAPAPPSAKVRGGTLEFAFVWEPEDPILAAARKQHGVLKVHVKKGVNLVAADTGFLASGKSDPYVSISTGGQTARTKTIKKELNPVWDETVEFAGTLGAFLGAPFELRVVDEDMLGKGDSLGEYKTNLNVLKTKTKAKFVQTLPTQGTIEFSIAWEMEDPSLTRARGEVGVLHVLCKKASNLKATDFMGGKSDPYVKVLAGGGQESQTKALQDNLDPVWNQRLVFKGTLYDFVTNPLTLKVLDENMVGGSTALGDVAVDMAPFLRDSDEKKHYSEKLATQGSVDFAVSWERVDAALQAMREAEGVLRIHLKRGQGLQATDTGFLQSGKSDPFVEIIAGEQAKKSAVIEKTTEPVWDEEIEFEGKMEDFIFNPIVFKVFDADMLGTRESLGECQVGIGMLQRTRAKTFNEDLSTQGNLDFRVTWAAGEKAGMRTAADRAAEIKKGRLMVHVKQAVDLMASDTGFLQSGKSDPYVVVRVGGQEQKTKTISKDLNPVWDETLTFEAAVDLFVGTQLEFEIFDSDLIGSDESLGELQVGLEKMWDDAKASRAFNEALPTQGTFEFAVEWAVL